MESEDIVQAESAMCNEMYRAFEALVTELTNLCVKSQADLEEYKKALPNLAIPNTVGLRKVCSSTANRRVHYEAQTGDC